MFLDRLILLRGSCFLCRSCCVLAGKGDLKVFELILVVHMDEDGLYIAIFKFERKATTTRRTETDLS